MLQAPDLRLAPTHSDRSVAGIALRSTVLAGIALVAFGPALARDLPDALLRCAAEADDARRLACYDAEVERLRTVPAATASTAPRARATEPASTAATVPEAGTAATSPALSPEDEFGRRADLQPDDRREVKEIEATVAQTARRPDGALVVTLDTGQVWAEIAPNSALRVLTGDLVKIERGALGSFLLIGPNKRSSKVTRVR